MAKQIFINLPVKDLKKTMDFFKKLGFTFNKQFTDKHAACMIIGNNMFSMLIAEKFFKTFTPKKISNAKKNSEVLIAMQLDSKKQVDDMLKKALVAGGKEPRKQQDYGWMYGRAFEDPNGHIWEAFYMDESKRPKS